MDDFELYNLTEDNVKTYIIGSNIINIRTLEEYDKPNVLVTACMVGDVEVVRDCINDGMDVTGERLLEHASYYGYYDIVKLLLENGSDPTSRGCISLTVSKSRKHYDVYRLLNSYIRKYKLKNLMK